MPDVDLIPWILEARKGELAGTPAPCDLVFFFTNVHRLKAANRPLAATESWVAKCHWIRGSSEAGRQCQQGHSALA